MNRLLQLTVSAYLHRLAQALTESVCGPLGFSLETHIFGVSEGAYFREAVAVSMGRRL